MSVDLSSKYLKESLCEDISFIPFSPPPPPPRASGWSQWVESLEAIDYDLRYLLQLSHDKFWSQVLYDKSLSLLLDSYLQHALRPHEEAWSVPEKVLELLRNIHRRVFMTFLRLSTHKEDQDHHFSPEVFGNLVHTHSLFTVPRLLDLCSIYGDTNGELLFKMIDNVISKQPQYRTDLYSVMNTNVKEALGVLVHKSGTVESSSEALDLMIYLTDITHSLSSLINVWTPAASIMCRAGLIESLVNCYEVSLPILKLKMKENKTKNFPSVCYQLVKINTSKIVHSLLMSCCHGDERKGGAEDQVLASISVIATGKMFYKEFEKHFSLRDVFQSLKEIYPNLDDTQLQYMLAESVSDVQPVAVTPSSKQRVKEKAPSIKESILYIKEMLPHLEEEFIKDCLKEYHYNQEVVIHHILEGTLPPHLLPHGEEETTPTETTPLPLEEGQSILEGRHGAYDYDDFDIFRREDIDLSRIHVGKKFESAREVLSDKSHLRYMKGVGLDLINYDEYDDEYDDTYDSHNIGSLDQDESDDVFTVKRLNVKGQFSSRGHKWLSEEEGVAESGDDPAHQPTLPTQPLKLLQRPVTPDKIKKEKTSPSLKNRQQQKGGAKRHTDQSKREEGGVKSKRAELQHEDKKPSKTERKDERSFDKDTSQSGERQRAFNERHKSSRANHNRKALSDKKRGGAY